MEAPIKEDELTWLLPYSSKRFIQSKKSFTLFVGPVGSAKTTAICFAMIYKATKQKVYKGVKNYRVCVVRTTVPQLKTTVIKTWTQIFPDTHMTYTYPITGKFSFVDSTDCIVNMELIFMPIDKPKDVKKLKSLEVSDMYLVEMDELNYQIFSASQNRIGRYPSKKMGGCVSPQILADSNAFTKDHWIYSLFCDKFPQETPITGDSLKNKNSLIIRQPPAVIMCDLPDEESVQSRDFYSFKENPHADNYKNLPINYYLDKIESKTSEEVLSQYATHFTESIESGILCYKMFDSEKHIKEETLLLESKTVIGWSFNINMICLVGQYHFFKGHNVLHIIKEYIHTDTSMSTFVENTAYLIDYNISPLPETISFIESETTKQAASDYRKFSNSMQEHKFKVAIIEQPNIKDKLEVGRKWLEGNRISVNPSCTVLIEGFKSGYRFNPSNVDKDMTKPIDNLFSTIHNILQTMLIGIEQQSLTGDMRKIPTF